jgi:hypothetical protein
MGWMCCMMKDIEFIVNRKEIGICHRGFCTRIDKESGYKLERWRHHKKSFLISRVKKAREFKKIIPNFTLLVEILNTPVD